MVGGRKVVKAEWSVTFGELLMYCSGLDCVNMFSVSYIGHIFRSFCTTMSASQIEGRIIKGVSGYI